MKIICEQVNNQTSYRYEPHLLPSKAFFLCLDATGLTPEESHISVLSAGYFDNESFVITQWLNETGFEDDKILKALFAFTKNHDLHTMITYYGSYFLMPFLAKKAKQCELAIEFDHFAGISHVDLYKIAHRMKGVLHLQSCRQKKVEAALKISRESNISGKDLVISYQHFVALSRPVICDRLSDDLKEDCKKCREDLLFHNIEGLCLLTKLSILLLFPALRDGKDGVILQVSRTSAYDFSFELSTDFPIAVTMNHQGMTFALEGRICTLHVPVFAGEDDSDYVYCHPLRGFKDYYYLPYEDRVVHRSLAATYPKNEKEKATADNCYEWLSIYHPSFDTAAGLTSFVGDCLYYILYRLIH
ncbi:MAG: ribonuclease H-like domain-containing protein [Lachnospiraceae bacterium]|nr:ribonuclease H-like domain-containing protein [Lachnospiraceae bacterium]